MIRMTKKLFLLSIIAFFCACSQKKSDQFSITFGSGTYKEPFVGILKSKPAFLCKTLDWPILRSLKSDTIVLSQHFDITFNEEAIRSGSTATILFLDTLYKPLSSLISVYCNDSLLPHNQYIISANNELQSLKVSLKIHPDFGDDRGVGQITIIGEELDVVNNLSLNTFQQSMGYWSFTHKTGWPVLIWLIWLLLLLLALGIGVLIIYLLFQYVIIPLGALLSNITFPAMTFPTIPTILSQKKPKIIPTQQKKADIKDQDDDIDPYIKEALRMENQLLNPIYGIAQKNDILEQLRLHLAKTYYTDRELNERCYQALQQNTQKALDKFNSFVGKTPKNGTWMGERGQSLFKLSQLNIHYAKCKSLGFIACKYTSFEPDFTPVTWPKSVVDISDLYAIYSCAELEKRGGTKSSFQYKAQMRIAKRIDPELREWWKKNRKQEEYDQEAAFWAWRDANDLLPHEDANCRTLRLVKRSAHMAFTHAGGIAHAKVIKDYFM